jgi:hypothetical protein
LERTTPLRCTSFFRLMLALVLCSAKCPCYSAEMQSKADKPGAKERPDGRKPLLLYIDPEVIHSLKIEALERNTHAYLIVEELLKNHQK